MKIHSARGRALLAAALIGTGAAHAAEPGAGDLDQRLKAVERQLEVRQEEKNAGSDRAATVGAGDQGFSLQSADEKFQLRFRALIQADARFFAGDSSGQNFSDTFLLRRVEPSLQGALGPLVGFLITPQFTAGSNSSPGASITDIYIDLKFDPAATVRVGRFKGPISGLENVQPTGATRFVERGLPTYLLPARDYGAQLQGAVLDGTLAYAVGIFNGAPDGKDASATDVDNRKELAARIFAEPFRNAPGFFRGLGVGIAGARGAKLGGNVVGGNQVLASYVTTGQNTFFSYTPPAAGTPPSSPVVTAAGDHTRYEPQLYFYRSSFGLLAEYAVSRQDVAVGGMQDALTHKAWQIAATYALTGEEETYVAALRPRRPYRAGGDGWGAWEVGARYGVLDIDDGAFPAFADPAKSASRAQEFGAVLSWYLTNNLKLVADYDQTSFTGGADGGGNRPLERAIFARAQVWY